MSIVDDLLGAISGGGFDEGRHPRDERGRWTSLDAEGRTAAIARRMRHKGWSKTQTSKMSGIERNVQIEEGHDGRWKAEGRYGGLHLVAYLDSAGGIYKVVLIDTEYKLSLLVQGIISVKTAEARIARARERYEQGLEKGRRALRSRMRKQRARHIARIQAELQREDIQPGEREMYERSLAQLQREALDDAARQAWGIKRKDRG